MIPKNIKFLQVDNSIYLFGLGAIMLCIVVSLVKLGIDTAKASESAKKPIESNIKCNCR